MHCENDGQILHNTLIEKGIIFEQVWQIYNKNKIPLTKVEYEKLNKESNLNGYSVEKTRINMEFNTDYVEMSEGNLHEKYKEFPETESSARLRYEYFKDQARKDVRKVLEILKSPLIYYEKFENTDSIPAIVAATFAAITDLKKYGSLSPTQMIAISPDTEAETIQKFLLHSKIEKYEESDYFILRVIENLKYFFNLTTKADERNFKESAEFNYKIIFDKNHYLIQKRKDADKETNGEQQEIKLDTNIVENEIENFKKKYLDILNTKSDENRKIHDLLEMADRMLRIYSDDTYRNGMDRINEIVHHLDVRTDDKIRLVVLLDFTEEPFKNSHEILGKRSSDNFYKQRLKLKKDESTYSRATDEIVTELENIKKAADQESKDLIRQSLKII